MKMFILITSMVFLIGFYKNIAARELVLIKEIPSPGSITVGLDFDGEYLWTSQTGYGAMGNKIYKIDSETGDILKTIDFFDSDNDDLRGVAYADGYLWAIAWRYYGYPDYRGWVQELYKIDTDKGKAVSNYEIPTGHYRDMTWDGQFIWATEGEDKRYFQFDINDGSVVSSFICPGKEAYGITYYENHLWVNYENILYKLTLSGSKTREYYFPEEITTYSLASGNDYFFVASYDLPKIYKIKINHSPSIPNTPVPENNSIDQPIEITLTWMGGDQDSDDPDLKDSVKYDVYFGNTENPSLISESQEQLSYSLNGLDYSTEYYWKIISKDYYSESTEGPLWKFQTLSSTSTSSVSTFPCLVEQIYGEDSEETELLRYLKDNVLTHTPEGQEFIRLYYEWNPVIIKAMEKDMGLKDDVKEMIDGLVLLFEENCNF